MSLAVILDMDGLMLDTERIAWDAWKQAGRLIRCPVTDDVYEEMVGLNVSACKELLRVRFGPDFPVDALEEAATVIYLDQLEVHGVPHKPGLVEFLGFLEERRIPRAVATSTDTELAIHKLRRAGVLRHFDVVVGGDQVSRGKPEPDIYLLAAARIRQSPANCLAIEDSEPGVRAASAAGMRSILIPDLRPPTSAALAAAHLVVSSLSAVIPVMGRMLQNT
jgi:HAD superfamily hydrolase (TIGR01509 family)